MSSIINGVASEYDMQKVSRTYESNSKLPQTSCRVPMPKTKEFGEKICENCDKEDVCMYKEECMKAVKDATTVIKELNYLVLNVNGKDIALICYEKPSDFCHRHLVAEWLNQNGYRCDEWRSE